MNLGEEIKRLERQAVIDLEHPKPTSSPISSKPGMKDEEEKTGRASDDIRVHSGML